MSLMFSEVVVQGGKRLRKTDLMNRKHQNIKQIEKRADYKHQPSS